VNKKDAVTPLDPDVERFLLEITGVTELFGMKPKEDTCERQAQPEAQMYEEPTFLEDDGSLVELPTFICFTGNSGLHGESPQESERKWTEEEALDYQLARDAIGGLISIISAETYAEENRENPDETRLERLNAERSRLSQERRDLKLVEHEKISRIRTAYGAAYRFYKVIASKEMR